MNPGDLLDILGAAVGFMLTLMVFSYIFGDNALFRIAISIFIGASAGYAAVLVIYNIIWQRIVMPILHTPGESALLVIPPLLLGVLLLLKTTPRLSWLGMPVLAFLVGVAAAAAIGGAVQGTLFPQVSATMDVLDPDLREAGSDTVTWFVNGIFILVGVAASLAYFHFSAKARPGQPTRLQYTLELLGQVGKGFVVIALGTIFAGVYTAALAAFVGRVTFVWNFIWDILERFFPAA